MYRNVYSSSEPLTVLEDSDAVRRNILGRPRLSSSGSDEAFELLRYWLKACRKQHPQCLQTFAGVTIQNGVDSHLPTRVIDVGDSEGESVKLIEANGLRAKYTAMTHCWGPPNRIPIITTKSNIHQHLVEIPWLKIPNSFKDAITTTRHLGLRYLWIDSLCIIQDDHDDWIRESSCMGSVYEQAELTLAASHASDSHQGLFLPRSPAPPSVRLADFWNNDIKEPVFATVILDNDSDLYPEKGPLNKRAWITQEWLLSRRMVFYTKGQMIWSCKTVTQRETGEKCFNTARNPKWKIIVEQYSDRQLTKATDKLIALEGIRAEYQKKSGDTYLNGIWQNALPDQLLWQVCNKSENVSPLGLPSWSWANVDSGVRFLPMDGARNLCHSIRARNADSLMIKAKMKPLEMNFGWQRPAKAPPDNDEDSTIERLIARDLELSNVKDMKSLVDRITHQGLVVGWVIFDSPQTQPVHSLTYGLAIMGTVSWKDEEKEDCGGVFVSKKSRQYWVLILRQAEGSQAYNRVGVGKVFERAWRTGATIEEVIII
jgi:hypothetical protein